jgi:hypothetical protein
MSAVTLRGKSEYGWDVHRLYMKDGRIKPGSRKRLANQSHGRGREYKAILDK